jgi:hypothetical protein
VNTAHVAGQAAPRKSPSRVIPSTIPRGSDPAGRAGRSGPGRARAELIRRAIDSLEPLDREIISVHIYEGLANN